ncbi:helix-turn-helix transcriptional regulator [Acidisoma cellulosilytica]|uniref:Helix-turn-helix transcriptional regulator n=1 Tax=Acidisoma cellulosilyticum TaxID=2802395 RepID=A0A963Z0S3_9PROT|nr:helix-turn-helix transcriptional regulator [Acidisoma cellulosilyticum]MCB8879743.1 helix-turn-helix transcriptional regulator [Acidisoma cellulosilyticum]
MSMTLPQVIAHDDDTVTLRRSDWVRLVEEQSDLASSARYDAMVRDIGLAEVKRLSYSDAELTQILDGISPITIWLSRMGMTPRALAEAAEISPSYLAEIESAKKPGSVAALAAIAKVFRVPIEHLVE